MYRMQGLRVELVLLSSWLFHQHQKQLELRQVHAYSIVDHSQIIWCVDNCWDFIIDGDVDVSCCEPPVFVAVMVNIVRSSNCAGVPLIVPVAVSKDRPSGILGLITQETISPEPVNIASSGSHYSLCYWTESSHLVGRNAGTSSTMVMLMSTELLHLS